MLKIRFIKKINDESSTSNNMGEESNKSTTDGIDYES
jgi:hypothetical protein